MSGMGVVRIDSLLSAVKPATTTAAARKEEQAGEGQAAGTTGFSEALAKARPGKKGGEGQESQEPSAKAAAGAQGGKVAKKQAKAKGKGDEQDGAQGASAADGSATGAPDHRVDSGTGEDGAASPVASDGDDSSDGSSTGDAASQVKGGQAPVVPDPTQAQVVAAAAGSPPPAPVPAAPAGGATGPAGSAKAKRAVQQVGAGDAKPVADDGSGQAAAASGDDGEHKGRVKDDGDAAHKDPDATVPATVAGSKGAALPVGDQAQSGADDGGDAEGAGAGVKAEGGKVAAKDVAAPVSRFTELFQQFADHTGEREGGEKTAEKVTSPTDVMVATVAGEHNAAKVAANPQHVQAAPALPATPEARFAEDNHPKVVTAVKTQMLPGGGAIQLRLDPPDLGPLRLEVRMEGGAMSASFVTANEQATSLLTHTLGQLKHALEGAGISVDKLQVQQGSKDQFAENSDQQRQQQGGMAGDQSSARQEQQRREMLNRMWRKVAGEDPVDLVA